MILSLGICLLAVGWLFVEPSRFPDHSVYYYCIVFAFAALLVGKQRATAIIPRGWFSLPAAIALILFYYFWGNLTGIGALILALGIILGSVLNFNRLFKRISDALVSLGAVLVLQLAGSYLYYFVLGPRAHSIQPAADILQAMFSLFGIESGVTTAGLQLITPDLLYQVVPSLNNMGLYFFWQVFIGIIALIVLGRMRIGAWWRAAIAIFGYMLLRYAGLLSYDISRGIQGTFWWPSITAWTSVWVFLLLGGRAFSPRPKPDGANWPPGLPKLTWRRGGLIVAGTVVAVFCWTMMQAYVDAGVKKDGRLLIDEYHSEWEWTDKVFDTVWYGQESTYNFYTGAEFLDKYYEMDRGYQKFTPEYLAQYAVVCLKVPTMPYEPDEIKAIHDYVENGGGLILIGDHTNVFGSATFLNQISKEFGVRYVPDIGYEIVTGDLNLYQMPRTLKHTVVQNMPFFLWGGQCTLRGDWGVRGVMVDLNLKTLPADYSERNFFPERINHTGYRYGPFFTVASATYGKGRIICFTDSTLISNFFILIPGRPELMLGLVEFANRMERFPGWRVLMFLLGGLGLLCAGLAGRRYGAQSFVWMLVIGLITFQLSAKYIEGLNRENYPLPEPIRPYKQLVIDGEYSRFFIPEKRLANNQDKDFHTFYVWTQRVDVYPRKYDSFDKCLDEAEKMGALMIIDPAQIPNPEQIERLKAYVKGGGTLVVMDDPENGITPTNTLLNVFSLELDFNNRIKLTSGPAVRSPAAPIWRDAAPVKGGVPLLRAPDGTPVVAQVEYGQGRVIAFGNSRCFERKTLGYTAMIPNAQQNAMSRFVYQLMDWIFNPAAVGVDQSQPDDLQNSGK